MMTLACPRPWAFIGLLFLLPAWTLSLFWFFQVKNYIPMGNKQTIIGFKTSLFNRLFFWTLAWIMIIFASSGFSWGTKLVPVQQTGNAIAFVFDVSWSMEAKDVPDGRGSVMSRLDAVGTYTYSLLDVLPPADISVTLAKGDGVTVVPITSDTNAVTALLPALSPQLITTVGSSIGSGMEKAAATFPVFSVAKRTVMVFTDGEETDGKIKEVTEKLVSSGIDVLFLGFGTTEESSILAGDGTTSVQTALREKALESIVTEINDSMNTLIKGKNISSASRAKAYYIPAQSPGSVFEIIETLQNNSTDKNWSGTVYEVEPKERWRLFTGLALVFLIAGIVSSELQGIFRGRNNTGGKTLLGIFLVFLPLMLTGCSDTWKGASDIAKGTLSWYQKDYKNSAGYFMESLNRAQESESQLLYQYSVYNLASTYMMQGENEAALKRLEEISTEATVSVQYAAAYNAGILYYQKGDFENAAQYFRQALELDNSKTEAKINLELSLNKRPKQSSAGSQELLPATEQKDKGKQETKLFSLIREQEENHWKNQQSQDSVTSGVDY